MLRNVAVTTAVLSLFACGSTPREVACLATDDLGRPIRLRRPPTRIISLAPSITELLFDLGAGNRLVGRTRWADFPPQVERVPSVGDGLSPNVELIIAQRPDLVVFYASPANEATIKRLERMGVATVSLRTDRLEDLSRAARVLGQLLDATRTADSLIARLAAETAVLEGAAPDPGSPSVLILAWDNPPIVVGGVSFLSEIVTLAGGRNAFGDAASPSLTTSIEVIARRDPDVVLVTSDSGALGWVERPEWQSVPAVRNRRFVIVGGSEFSRPSFRAPLAARALRAVLAEWRR